MTDESPLDPSPPAATPSSSQSGDADAVWQHAPPAPQTPPPHAGSTPPAPDRGTRFARLSRGLRRRGTVVGAGGVVIGAAAGALITIAVAGDGDHGGGHEGGAPHGLSEHHDRGRGQH